MPNAPFRLLLALLLGLASSWLVACGGGGSKGLLAGTSADGLKSQLDTISNEVQEGRCDRAKASAHELGAKVNALPASVDAKLRAALGDGAKVLLAQASRECRAPKTEVPTTSTPSTDTTPSTPSPTSPTPSPTTSTPSTDSTPTTPSTSTTPKTTPAPTTPSTPSNGGAGSGGGLNGGGGAGAGSGR